jgi:hypothetical protein
MIPYSFWYDSIFLSSVTPKVGGGYTVTGGTYIGYRIQISVYDRPWSDKWNITNVVGMTQNPDTSFIDSFIATSSNFSFDIDIDNYDNRSLKLQAYDAFISTPTLLGETEHYIKTNDYNYVYEEDISAITQGVFCRYRDNGGGPDDISETGTSIINPINSYISLMLTESFDILTDNRVTPEIITDNGLANGHPSKFYIYDTFIQPYYPHQYTYSAEISSFTPFGRNINGLLNTTIFFTYYYGIAFTISCADPIYSTNIQGEIISYSATNDNPTYNLMMITNFANGAGKAVATYGQSAGVLPEKSTVCFVINEYLPCKYYIKMFTNGIYDNSYYIDEGTNPSTTNLSLQKISIGGAVDESRLCNLICYEGLLTDKTINRLHNDSINNLL